MPAKRPIYLVEAPTQYLLASTFLRFQEHYESPKFRGKIFSLEEFMDSYAKDDGTFSYFKDWEGFNLPSCVLRPFREGRFDPLTKKESRLLALFKDVPEPFYVIGATKLDLETLRHEVVHALFYFDPVYRKKVLKLIRSYDTRNFRKALRNKGYHPKVFEDEINAYAGGCAKGLIIDLGEYGLKLRRTKPVRVALRKLFEDHFGFSLRDMGKEGLLRLMHRRKL